MSAATDAYVATAPLFLWPLNETSGTNANELVANQDGTATGIAMGGMNAPSGIGGKAPLFTGTEYITLNTAALLGGETDWSIGAWVYYGVTAADTGNRFFYGEASTVSGNDFVAAGVNGGSSAGLLHTYGDNSAVITRTSSSVFIYGLWTFVVYTRVGATIEAWWNLGRRMARADAVSPSTWTNTSLAARVGLHPRLGGWKGGVSHLALWDRVLDVEDDMRPIYEACTPLTRTLPTRTFFRDNAIWNQDLTVVGAEPDIAASSAATATKLAAQATAYSCGANASTGPFFTTNTSRPVQRVRIAGGQNNIAVPPLELWNELGTVRMPSGFTVPVVSDREGTIYDEDADKLYEFIQMQQTFTPPDPPSSSVQSGGTLPAGLYVYAIMGADASEAFGQWSFTSATVNGSQRIALTWKAVEGIDHFRLLRTTVGGVLPWGLVTTLPAGTLSFSDDGSHSWTSLPALVSATPTYVSTDWGCSYGGVIDNTDNNIGHYESPHLNWGPGASGMPLWGGTVSLHEALNYDIPHAIAMALPEVDASGFVYPAQRNDGHLTGSNTIKEGTRLQLDPDFDVMTIPWLFERAVAVAMQKYGAYIRDVSNEVSIYIEDQYGAGRDFYPDIFQGRHSYEICDGFTFPWSQMRVIEPSWTQARTVTAPDIDKPALETLTEDFDSPVIDVVKWPTTAGVTAPDGQGRIVTNPFYQGGLSSSPNYYSLTASSFFFQAVQLPLDDSGDEAGLTLYASDDLTCFIEFVVSDDGLLIAGYKTSGGVRTRVAQLAYVPGDHAWWRIREASGTVHWDVSADGTNWDSYGSVLWSSTGWSAAKLESMFAKFFAGNFNAVVGSPDFVVDNINVPAVIVDPVPGPASDKFVKLNVMIMDPEHGTYQGGFIDADALFENLEPKDPLP